VTLTQSATSGRTLVVDTNILVRAALGRRVMELLEAYSSDFRIVTPEMAFEEMGRHLADVLVRRGTAASVVHAVIDQEILPKLLRLVGTVPAETYVRLEADARMRLSGRDEDDWPFLALAMWLDCPIWTEDTDFFGAGVATWTTDRIEQFFRSDE